MHRKKGARKILSPQTKYFYIVLLLALGLLTISFCSAEVTKTYTINAMNDEYYAIVLNEGNKFIGDLSITGGNSDIHFYIVNPQQTVILDLETVYQEASFNFTATESGQYTLCLENHLPSLSYSTKIITISYYIESENILGSIFAIVIAILVALEIFFIYKIIKPETHAEKKMNNLHKHKTHTTGNFYAPWYRLNPTELLNVDSILFVQRWAL